MLTPEEAEEIVGDADPAADAEVAHTSAWALLGVPGADFDAEHVARLREVANKEGVGGFADLWDRSPAFTLPGALWRLYLLWQWDKMDPEVLENRFADGVKVLQAQGKPVSLSLPEALAAADAVLSGHATEDDLAEALALAAEAMRIMATGITYGPEWILEDNHQLAHPVTRRPEALLKTAAELEESSRLANYGNLH